ncbi:MAG: hypothetical protein KC423_29540, partial [Anaerolineales bacterium]|nr:hypothetical protein [Anaerolineales bacterium]
MNILIYFCALTSLYMHILRITILFALLGNGSWLLAQQPVSPLVSSFQDYLKMKKETPFHFEWISLGPVVNSARVEAVQIDPRNPAVIYTAFG